MRDIVKFYYDFEYDESSGEVIYYDGEDGIEERVHSIRWGEASGLMDIHVGYVPCETEEEAAKVFLQGVREHPKADVFPEDIQEARALIGE